MTADAAAESDMDVLLGVMLPGHVRLLLEVEWPEVDPDRVGVLLCGDLYARRGKGEQAAIRFPSGLPFGKPSAGLPAWTATMISPMKQALIGCTAARASTIWMSQPSLTQAHQRVALHRCRPVTAAAHRWPGRHYRQAGQAEPAAGEALPAIREQAAEAAAGLLAAHQSPGIPELGLEGEPLIRQALEAGPETVVFADIPTGIRPLYS